MYNDLRLPIPVAVNGDNTNEYNKKISIEVAKT